MTQHAVEYIATDFDVSGYHERVRERALDKAISGNPVGDVTAILERADAYLAFILQGTVAAPGHPDPEEQ